MMIGFKKLILLPPICLLYAHFAHGAAWTLNKGESSHIFNLYYYESSEFFDKNSLPNPQDTYYKIEVSDYIEYGVTDDSTLGLQLSAVLHEQSNFVAGGMGDPEIFFRYKIWENQQDVISIQPLIKIPISDGDVILPIGTGEFDFEIKALWGHSYSWLEHNHFTNLEAAYRKRMGGFSDELSIDGTLGFSTIWDSQIFLQSFTTISINADDSDFSNSVPVDYNATKLQISLVKEISETYSLQMGFYRDIYGKNSGKGNGLLLSLWKKF